MIKKPRTSPLTPPRVALFLETSAGSGRDMLRGIARYVRESGPWALHHEPRMLQFTEGWTPAWLSGWQGEGILGRFRSNAIIKAVKRAKVPVVDLLGTNANPPFPLVEPDNTAVARLAAEHLIGRGFHQFGYIGPSDVPWSQDRWTAFQKTLNERGFPCDGLHLEFENLQESWDEFIEQTARWIRDHAKPFGLMVCWDAIGPPVTQACREAGVAVPEEVAIVGVDNDETLCSICDPPLSSVCPNHEEVGYQGAALLDRMMAGEPAPKQRILLQPRVIVVRQSTDVSAIEDPAISQALRLIREHACNGLQVREVAEHVPLSRSVLQRRFQAIVGRSVHDEIIRVQLRKAEELLRETELSIGSIAAKAGFNHQEYMGAVFKSRTGMTPREYRKRFRTDTVDANGEPKRRARRSASE
jgi:LacI family transcriptional regulator